MIDPDLLSAIKSDGDDYSNECGFKMPLRGYEIDYSAQSVSCDGDEFVYVGLDRESAKAHNKFLEKVPNRQKETDQSDYASSQGPPI